MASAWITAGIGFGDEGKGTITEFVTKSVGAKTVVRYNGGCQAAHNVVTPDGKHHTFSQFGSGAFVGASTYLSKHVIVDPLALMVERAALKDKGGCVDIAIDNNALLVTQYHRAANRLRELLRGDARHGSCGMGIGEARADAIATREKNNGFYGDTPRACYLKHPGNILKMLEYVYELKREEFAHLSGIRYERELELLREPPRVALERYGEAMRAVDTGEIKVVDWRDYRRELRDECLVFEGAQGVLLDENYGFHPYSTWTDTTFNNAINLCKEVNATDCTKIGVVRTHMTRHGAGPMPTEDPELQPLSTEHNKTGDWQGKFRVGHLDLVLLDYAIKVVGGVDALAVTHMDAPAQKICTNYEVSGKDKAFFVEDPCGDYNIGVRNRPDFDYQTELACVLSRVKPQYQKVEPHHLGAWIFAVAGAPIKIASIGPTVRDKVWL